MCKMCAGNATNYINNNNGLFFTSNTSWVIITELLLTVAKRLRIMLKNNSAEPKEALRFGQI